MSIHASKNGLYENPRGAVWGAGQWEPENTRLLYNLRPYRHSVERKPWDWQHLVTFALAWHSSGCSDVRKNLTKLQQRSPYYH